MENRASYILLGSFVLAVFACAMIVILWLGQGQREYAEYHIVFEEQVSGLNVGAAVRFNGIQVGEVRSLDFNEDLLVEAVVRVEENTPIKTDTVARLEIVGFTGLAVIQFEGGTAGAQALADTVSGIPTIRAQQSGIGALLSGSSSIIAATNEALSKENLDNIGGILADIKVLTGTLADGKDDISLIIANTAQISQDLARASDDLDRLLNNIDALAVTEGAQALTNVKEVAESARSLIVDLQAVVDENRENIQGFTGSGLAQVGPGMTEMRRLLRAADVFLRQLERDPRGYLLGEPVPEYETSNK